MPTASPDVQRDLDSLSQLSTGIAHALSEVTTTVLGYADMLLVRHGTSDTDRGDILEIQKAACRGALLVQQLRAFSCTTAPETVDVDLSEMVGGVHQALRGLIHENISFACNMGDAPAPARLDPRQVSQALVNLVLTAQETITAGRLEVLVQTEKSLTRGPISCIRITGVAHDAGGPPSVAPAGIPPAPAASGLNLSAAYGIVRRNGGALSVDRRPGGIVLTVAFPSLVALGPGEAVAPRVLVVDDEDAVRHMTARMLRCDGYRVLEAATAFDALTLFETHRDDIAVVLSDIALGDDSGVTLVRQLTTQQPSLPAILMSGHGRAALTGVAAGEAMDVLEKPFTTAGLLEAVRAAVRA